MVDYLPMDDVVKSYSYKKTQESLSLIISISFNKDRSWMAVGTTQGFRIYETNDFTLIDINEGADFILDCGISAIALLNKTILIGLVTDGTNSRYPNSKVYIWDKYNKELKAEYKHTSKVEMISLTQKYLFVLTYNNIIIWNIESNIIIKTLSSRPASKIFSISLSKNTLLLGYKDEKRELVISNINANFDWIINVNIEIDLFTFSNDGSKIAIVDTTGIYIYVYDTIDQKLLNEFIRGKTTCKMTHIQFSDDDKFLGCINDKGTLHIFNLRSKQQIELKEAGSLGLISTMSSIATKYLPKILYGVTSFAKFHSDMTELNKVKWIDSVKTKIEGPIFIMKSISDTIYIIYESGLASIVKINENEGGEAKEKCDLRSRWFEPSIQKKLTTGIESLDDDEEGYVIIS